MSIKSIVLATSTLLISGAAMAYPGAGPGGVLDFSARDLTASAQNMAYVLNYNTRNADLKNDAETLVLAAEHFQEEVELGPEDLPVDMNTIQETLDELRSHFTSCREYAEIPAVRQAWFRVEEANIQLRQAFYGGGSIGGGDDRGDDDRGDDDRGGWDRGGDRHDGRWGGRDGRDGGREGGDHRFGGR